jgi:energy-coupling factor transporter transmembrane protein EcfT
MFYGVYPPWAACLIASAVLALIGFAVCLSVAIYRRYYSSRRWRLFPIAGALLLIGAASVVFASIQAYKSQIILYDLSVEQGFVHVDSIHAVGETLHAYNNAGNCFVYAKYDAYQKAIVIDASHLRNSTISLNGSTVYGLTTKPLTQNGINQLCEANYGEDAFNNED